MYLIVNNMGKYGHKFSVLTHKKIYIQVYFNHIN